MQSLTVHQALYFQPLHPFSGTRAVERGGCGRHKSIPVLQAEPKEQATVGLPKCLWTRLVISNFKVRETTILHNNRGTQTVHINHTTIAVIYWNLGIKTRHCILTQMLGDIERAMTSWEMSSGMILACLNKNLNSYLLPLLTTPCNSGLHHVLIHGIPTIVS